MARRTNEQPSAEPSLEPQPAATTEPANSPSGDTDTSAPEIALVEPPAPFENERFRVETSVYYVPHLGFGAVFVPAGTIVTRSSHDLQKLLEQGAKLRPEP